MKAGKNTPTKTCHYAFLGIFISGYFKRKRIGF